MEQSVTDRQTRKNVVKSIIKALHSGAAPEELAQRFQQVIHGVSAVEIAEIEQELIQEGMPHEDVRRLCDVHLAVFREALDKEDTLAPAGHPINILMAEHQFLLGQAQELARLAQRVGDANDTAAVAKVLDIERHMRDSESHYVREENVLFPFLEKHGITQPPAIMWMEHDQIRQIKKNVYGVIDGREGMAPSMFADELSAAAVTMAEMLASHFYKENRILFPTSMRLFSDDEWLEVRREFDELGYCCFTPERPMMPGAEVQEPVEAAAADGSVRFGTGTLPLRALESVLNALPVDITFVDDDDRVRYFNDISDRIFPRAKAVLGRSVQRCHPQKSIAVVNRIMDEFREGTRDSAEFWVQLDGKFVYIRYFPVRDGEGNYLGTLEVMQDATRIRRLEGEKRLLD